MTRYEMLQVILTAFLLAAAIIAACIYGCQLSEMQKSTKAATKAAKAAEDSVTFARESAHLDQRAWVGSMGIRGNPPEVNKQFISTVTVKNRGKSFAKNVKVIWHLHELPTQQTPDFDAEMDTTGNDVTNSVGLLPPDGEYLLTIGTSAPPLDQTIVDKIKSGESRVFVFGKITYTDVFNCHHWTTFCYALRRDGTFEIWESHNNADDNRCG